MSTFPDGLFQYGGVPVGGSPIGLGIGNVYYVIQTSNDSYASMVEDKQGIYHNDGSWRVHTTIASALSSTVTERNDYVIIVPDNSDYDLTATCTMDKKSVHVICPAGLIWQVGAPNAARIHQNTADTPIFTMSGAACEVAGLYFKNAASTAAAGATIYGATGSYCVSIHNNFFAYVSSGGTNSPCIANIASSEGFGWGKIWNNKFYTMTGASTTTAAMILIAAQAGGVDIDGNEFMVDDGNTVTAAINSASIKGTIKNNYFHEMITQGGTGAGTFTGAITITNAQGVIGNRGSVLTGHMIAGGTANACFSDNHDGHVGGATEIET